MGEIMTAIASQVSTQIASANNLVDARLRDFQNNVLDRFFKDGGANPEAFSDPDFLYIIRASQLTFARSGNEQVRDTLIDLITRRSQETGRTRLSLSLNDAVEKAARLTANEFAELSLTYLLRMTKLNSITSLADFGKFFSTYIAPLLPDVSEKAESYQFLEAQSCGTISSFGSNNVIDSFRSNYAGVFSSGFDRQQLEGQLPSDRQNALDSVLIPCLNDPGKLQFAALDREVFDAKTKGIDLTKDQLNNSWNMFMNTVWSGDTFLSKVEPVAPQIRTLVRLWSETPLGRFLPNATGIAIGHSNLVRTCQLDADLSIWIE